MRSREKKKKAFGLREKIILLFLQILLPFGLYMAMRMDASYFAWISAGALILSMGVMVWVG